MADAYADLTGAGSATSPYDTWAKATSSIQTALTQAGNNGRVFVKTDSGATNKDTAAAGRTLTFPTTDGAMAFVFGCKSGTTNEPPVDSDLCVRGTDNLPIFEATGAGNDVTFTGLGVIAGIQINAADQINTTGDCNIIGRNCKFVWNSLFYSSSSARQFELHNCDFAPTSSGTYFLVRSGGIIQVYGGLLSGTAMTNLVNNIPEGFIEFYGCDIDTVTGTYFIMTSANSFRGRIVNCAMPASYTLASGAPDLIENNSYVELIASSNATGLTSGTSVRDYELYCQQGSVNDETTAVRTGGADDGASGGFSYALLPTVNTTIENGSGIWSPPLTAWIAGDGSTSYTITVFIANSGAADYNTDDVEMIVLSPDAAGTAQHNYAREGTIINGSATAITDDTTSTWGTGGNNPQKIQTTITPDFEGQVYVFVKFMKRFAASPETLYVDPRLDIA